MAALFTHAVSHHLFIKMSKYNINELKSLYVGKTYSYLTVLDIYKDPNRKRYFAKCLCTCGKETCKQLDKILSGHTKSCGCYKFSEEYSDLKKQWATDNPDKVQSRIEKFKQWCKDNPDKVKEKTEKRLQTYAKNPEILQRQVANRKLTLENNPDIQTTINNKISQFYKDNPDRHKALSEACKKSYIDNPEHGYKISQSLKLYYSDESNRKDISVKVKSFCENNPEAIQKQAELHKQWFLDNRKQVIAQGIELSQKFKDNRSEALDDSYLLFEVVHPSQMEDLISGNIKVTDSILTKCPICGNYSGHTFGNVWRLYDRKFRTGYAPMCDKCRSLLVTSHYEEEIANCVSTFYNGTLIRNSRDIISPLELDLYYPEKKIAIEFNGDYWHSDKFKDEHYHYNKFKACYDLGITLVSIFEFYYISSKDAIFSYIHDLFDGIENRLSFIDKDTINLNYPIPNLDLSMYTVKNNSYTNNECKVYTCGHGERI